MKSVDRIPTSKIKRASKLLSTGAKVGVNYIKYNLDKITIGESVAKENLNSKNANDIYESLQELKGSALKVAQMLSMEKNILPQAYVDKFSLSQFSVPPLSSPLVIKTFKKYFGKHPLFLFDTFDFNSVNAASIGQVHKATKDGKELAVKIQYPGVANSIQSDLALVKPIALKMFNIKGKGSDKYFKEVESKLIEETDYRLEIKQSKAIASACSHMPNLVFPKYYEDYSTERILTMDFMYGDHLSEFCAKNTDKDAAQKVGQTLWDFFMYQIHHLKKVHADPHPGNFLVDKNNKLIALDFGCVKKIPLEFYQPYFELAKIENLECEKKFKEKLYELEILKNDDSKKEISFFSKMFYNLLSVFTLPFQYEKFDFSDLSFFGKINDLAQEYGNNNELKKMNANRGSKHFIYMNRTFFGLYNLMFDLKASSIIINRSVK